jgi:hypothetical protein
LSHGTAGAYNHDADGASVGLAPFKFFVEGHG